MEKEWTCCFTGHREIDAKTVKNLQKMLKKTLLRLIEEGYSHFISGGALGFDTLAAEAVLNLKNKKPHIRLTMALPCRNQDKFWNEMQKAKYKALLSLADSIFYTDEEYNKGCMFKRNRYMVDKSSCVIAYLNSCYGGTKYTVDYAKKTNRRIIFLDQNSSCQLSLLF